MPRDYPEKPEKAYLYGTCLIDVMYPQAGIDAIDLLESLGIEVIYPQDQSCCGQPAYTSGYEDEARQVAKNQMLLFPEDWPVVILSGSCGGMMHKHYPYLFKDDPVWSDNASKFANRVFEFTEFLVHVAQFQPVDHGMPESIVLHTSCTARREMNVHQSCEALLSHCSQVERRVQSYEKECCGFGGTFSVRYPEISGAMVRDKVDAIDATDADCLISADCGCMMNIVGAAELQGKHQPHEHIASWLWRRVKEG